MRHVDHLTRLNFDQFKVSVKASDVFLAVESYRLLAKEIEQPLHLGITEAGGARAGAVKSALGLGLLLSEGIGDTLRISLAADPVEEIKVGFDILKSLRIRSRGINFIACPTCSRQEFDVIGTVIGSGYANAAIKSVKRGCPSGSFNRSRCALDVSATPTEVFIVTSAD